MNLREEVAQGQQADDLLRNPMLQQVFGELQSECVQEWLNADPNDMETQHVAKMRANALYEVQRKLRIKLENGKLAASVLEKQES